MNELDSLQRALQSGDKQIAMRAFTAVAAETLRRDFVAFCKAAWAQIAPQKLVWGWHLDSLCLPAETTITTEDGPMSIGLMVESGWQGKVLSYCHITNTAEWKPVKSLMRNKPQPLYKIKLSNDTELEITGNHPVFVEGSGYTRADCLRPGDVLLRLHALREEVQAHVDSQILQFGMQIFRPKVADKSLRSMRADVRQNNEQGNSILQCSLSASSRSRETNIRLCSLWAILRKNTEPTEHKILLQKVQISWYAATVTRLRSLWKNVCTQIKKQPILRQEMLWTAQDQTRKTYLSKLRRPESIRWRDMPLMRWSQVSTRIGYSLQAMRERCLHYSRAVGAFTKNARRFLQPELLCAIHRWLSESQLSRWLQSIDVQAWVQVAVQEGHQARAGRLLPLQYGRKIGRPSYRSGRGEPRSVEPCWTVPPLSFDATSQNSRSDENIERLVIVSIEKSVRVCDRLYNIEVSDNNNYFANGILVHNCEHLTYMSQGDIRFLMVMLPPRSTKSLICSVMWPVFHWLHFVRTQFLCASVDDRLSLDFSRLSRRIIESPWFQNLYGGEFYLLDDENQGRQYRNDKGGQRVAVSVQGRVIGSGGDIQICLPPDEIVWTEFGQASILELVSQREAVKVWSFNLQSGQLELKPIVGWHENPGRAIIEIELSDGARVRCTAEHKIWTLNRGWTQAGELTGVDMLPCLPVFIEPIVFNYRTPKFIRDAGHSAKTYCLTVEGNHNFYAGSNPILVANCDDPNSVKQIESDSVRHATLAWHDNEWRSRLNNPKKSQKLYVAQRTHDADVLGHVLAQEKKRWVVLCLPLEMDLKRRCITYLNDGTGVKPEAQPIFKDPRQKEGEMLDPKRFDAATAQIEKDIMSPRAWNAQYQQQPEGAGGLILKRHWWRPWVWGEWHKTQAGKEMPLPEFFEIIQVYDTAFEEKEEADFSARTSWGIFTHEEMIQDKSTGSWRSSGQKRTCAMLLDSMKEKLTYPDLRDEVIRSNEAMDPTWILIEKKSSGHSLLQELRRMHLPVKAYGLAGSSGRGRGQGDLIARAHESSLMLAKGCIWYCPRQWAYNVIDEAAAFPSSDHDDVVSTLTMAWQYLRRFYDLTLPDEDTDNGFEINPFSWSKARRYA